MKPRWLDKKISLKSCVAMKEVLRDLEVETVCEQAMCPNIGECFTRNEATFLILGKNCTRRCSFCGVKKSDPGEPDLNEPFRVARAARQFNLKHVVITSVTRDDLADGGAGIFAQAVTQLRKAVPQAKIEVLIPDFGLSLDALKTVVGSGPDIIAHNLETVPSLYKQVRQGADYFCSLNLLLRLKKMPLCLKVKSALMLGLGEKEEEVVLVMQDLRSVGCDFLSIGQYLAPSRQHYPVKDYIVPKQFDFYKEKGRQLGFLHIESAPYARSSYKAAEYLACKEN